MRIWEKHRSKTEVKNRSNLTKTKGQKKIKKYLTQLKAFVMLVVSTSKKGGAYEF